MPFTKDGIQPDIIINPQAIPSRMTIAQLIETIVGKAAALRGNYIDGTPFEKYGIEDIQKELEKHGYNKNGYETLTCGMTGKKMKVQIFIGPTYYLRLKHLVKDKLHSRAKGPRQQLTRQPLEGRAREGGLRFGEMERDCMISHGLSSFLKERLMDTSDKYSTYVCNNCGIFATKMLNKPIWTCYNEECKNKTKISVSKINIPYAFKLLVQELMAINILPRIRTDMNDSVHAFFDNK